MKNTNFLICFLLLFALSLTSSGCISLNGFQTGRTVGKNNKELSYSFNGLSPTSETGIPFGDKTVAYDIPYLEVSGRYGISEKIDIGLSATLGFNILLDGKVQILGTRQSRFALALGAGISSVAIDEEEEVTRIPNFHIPLYASLHSKKNNIHVYFSPRWIRHYGNNVGNFYGANAGILFGKKTNFGIDLGSYLVRSGGRSDQVFQIGAGVNIHFDKNK